MRGRSTSEAMRYGSNTARCDRRRRPVARPIERPAAFCSGVYPSRAGPGSGTCRSGWRGGGSTRIASRSGLAGHPDGKGNRTGPYGNEPCFGITRSKMKSACPSSIPPRSRSTPRRRHCFEEAAGDEEPAQDDATVTTGFQPPGIGQKPMISIDAYPVPACRSRRSGWSRGR